MLVSHTTHAGRCLGVTPVPGRPRSAERRVLEDLMRRVRAAEEPRLRAEAVRHMRAEILSSLDDHEIHALRQDAWRGPAHPLACPRAGLCCGSNAM